MKFKKEDKEKANSILKYAIRMCQGQGCRCPNNTRFALVLRLKEDLECMGAVWQSKCLQWHLHNAMKNGVMTLKVKKEGGASKDTGSVLSWYKNIPDGSENGGGV